MSSSFPLTYLHVCASPRGRQLGPEQKLCDVQERGGDSRNLEILARSRNLDLRHVRHGKDKIDIYENSDAIRTVHILHLPQVAMSCRPDRYIQRDPTSFPHSFLFPSVFHSYMFHPSTPACRSILAFVNNEICCPKNSFMSGLKTISTRLRHAENTRRFCSPRSSNSQ